MTSSSNKMLRNYVLLADRKLLEDENLYELKFNEIWFVGCSYFTHWRRQRHSTMYVILCEYTLRNEVFKKLFNGEDADLFKCTIIHYCHKICDNCYKKFKEDGRRCNYLQILGMYIIQHIVNLCWIYGTVEVS